MFHWFTIMHGVNLWKRVLVILFPFFCFSCYKPCQKWECERIQTHYPCFNSAKAVWWTDNEFQGIDVQIICTAFETQVYLDIYTFEFPFIEDNPLQTEIIIHTENQDYSFIADRFEGGQRLLLPQGAVYLIFNLLSAYSSFTIVAENYSETISPVNFEEALQCARQFCKQEPYAEDLQELYEGMIRSQEKAEASEFLNRAKPFWLLTSVS